MEGVEVDEIPMTSLMITPPPSGVRSEEIYLDNELVSILCHRSRRRLRDLQVACKVTLRLDRSKQVLHVTGADAGIEMAKQQIQGLSGPRQNVPLKVWAELMRTRTLSLEDIGGIQNVSVAWVQERSGCRLHIERGNCEVRIFGGKAGAEIASKIIDEMDSLCSEETVFAQDSSILTSPTLQSIAHACSATFRIQGLGISVLGLRQNVSHAVSQLKLFLEAPQSYHLPEGLPRQAQAGSVQESVWPQGGGTAAASSQPLHKMEAEVSQKRNENVCPTCNSGPFCSNCGQMVWRLGYNPATNQASCLPPAMQYQFVVMQPMEAGGNMNSMNNMNGMNNMNCMMPANMMQSPMMPMCLPMAVAMPQTDLAMGG